MLWFQGVCSTTHIVSFHLPIAKSLFCILFSVHAVSFKIAGITLAILGAFFQVASVESP